MVADSPGGPWKDPLGEALLTEGLVPTDPYDPGIVEFDGEYYIFFGVWDFYMARLNEDMISLAETPKRIIINNPRGPYNQDGLNKENPTDDKAFIHQYKGRFYLSKGRTAISAITRRSPFCIVSIGAGPFVQRPIAYLIRRFHSQHVFFIGRTASPAH